MPQFEWEVVEADYRIVDAVPTTVTGIHWKCVATEGSVQAESNGRIDADLPFAATYAELEAAVLAEVQEAVERQLSLNIQKSTVETGTGRTWEIEAGTAAWAPFVAYAVGDVALFNGVPYTCIQAHTSQPGWTPVVVPALWEIQGQGGDGPVEWVAGEAVAVGDQRTYEGVTYEVIQAHTTQVGWEPPNVPALWGAL